MEKYIDKTNAAHIVYASDNGFADIMGISIISLFEKSKDLEEIVLYILDSGISETNKQNIENICQNYHRKHPIWIEAKDISEELSMNVAVDRGSLSQYARLFISRDLPENLERVIYLDCDIIFDQSIKELWELDLQGKTIAALMDAFSSHYRQNINLQPRDIMFNSGVMVIDLVRWKKLNIEEKLLKFISMKNGKIQQGDQGALNAILSHDICCFSPKFNTVSIFYDFSYDDMLVYRKPPEFYTKEEIEDAIEHPVIIHFTTSFLSKRPWVEGCAHRYVNKWLAYKEISPWKDEKLRCDNASFLKKAGIKLYQALPHNMAIVIAGVLQAYARPLKNRMRK